jgi:hypothetical protein
MASNNVKIQKGFLVLLLALSVYVYKELKQEFGAYWLGGRRFGFALRRPEVRPTVFR